MITVLVIALACLCLVLSLYVDLERTRAELIRLAVVLISDVEQYHQDLTGPEKMQHVVELLIAEVPAIFKQNLTAERLQELAQDAFNSMRKYAKSRSKG